MLFCPLPTLQRVVNSIQKEGGLCEITNINSPIQTVVSGDKPSLKELSSRLRQEGRRIAVKPLNVAYPFHASILLNESKAFDAFVQEGVRSGRISIADPVVPVISNVDGAIVVHSTYCEL